MLNVAIAFRLTWYLFPPNAKSEASSLWKCASSLSTACLTESENYSPTSSVMIQESRSMRLTRRKYPDWYARRSIYFGGAIARRFRERTNDKKTSCDRKININVPINYHENNLGSWPRIYEIQSVFVVSASCDISIKVSSKHLLLLVFKVAPARWKRGDNFCITLFWRKTQNDVRSFRSYIEFIEF